MQGNRRKALPPTPTDQALHHAAGNSSAPIFRLDVNIQDPRPPRLRAARGARPLSKHHAASPNHLVARLSKNSVVTPLYDRLKKVFAPHPLDPIELFHRSLP